MRVCTTCGQSYTTSTDRCPHDGGKLITMIDTTGSQHAEERVAAGATSGQLALTPRTSDDLTEGMIVGDYKIERRIGVGGMGVVYGARHPVIGKRAAIKVLNAKFCADNEAVARFVQEAQAVNHIGHANIVDIFDFGTLEDGRSYLVMEWLQGEALSERLERGPMTPGEIVPILIALTRALEAAHTAGVVHRDLKPENVFLVAMDDELRIKLLDFGIAKLSTVAPTSNRTATGITMGTPLFMSPEQARGSAIDARSDIYSLGVLAYAMVCRVTPFEDEESAVEVLHAHINKPPRPPHEHTPDVEPALETLILEMLAKSPVDRPAVADIRARLKEIVSAIVAAGSFQFESFTSETPAPRARTAPAFAESADQDFDPLASRPVRSRRWILLPALGTLAIGVVAFLMLRRDDHAATETSRPAPSQRPAVVEPSPPALPAPAAVPEPKIVASVGTIEIEASPPGATVTIDGRQLATAGGRARVELAAGSYLVASSATGYRPSSQRITVTASQVTALTIRLRPKSVVKPKRDSDAVVNPFDRRPRKP